MILKIFLILFSIYWVVSSILCYRFIKKQIQTKLRWIFQKDEVQIKQQYKPFQRTDFSNWKISQIYINCFLIFPPKFLLILSITVFAIILIYTLVFIQKLLNKTYVSFLRAIFRFYMRGIVAPTLRLFCGIKQIDVNNKTCENPIVISNHISWWQILYYITSRWPLAFLAKKQVASWPLIGIIAKFAGSIFIERQNTQAREATLSLIKQRCNKIKVDPIRYPPLLIFPEGTTTNGNFILSFKRGAFQSMQSIQVSILNYKSPYWNVSMDAMGQLTNIILFLCHRPQLQITNVYNVSPKSENVEEYMSDCQNIMCSNGVQRSISKSGFRHKKQYQKDLLIKCQNG